MDSSNSKTTSSPSDILPKYFSKNALWRRHIFHSTYRCQAFPFRGTFIRYITNNPSTSKLYQKIIRSCKHFFIKNPIIIVPESSFIRTKGWYTLEKCPSNEHPNVRSVYLNETTSKIWITDSLIVHQNTPNTPGISSFMPRIYQCDATSIFIYGQMFPYNDLMVIASKCEILNLTYVVIMNNDEIVPEIEENYFETAVSLEALFKALPNVKKFTYNLPDNSLNIITTKTAEELLKNPHFLSLDEFGIMQIPEIFNIKCFYGHIKENKKTKIKLEFSDQISDAYKTRLQTTVDEILETENPDYKVPFIHFTGITNSSGEKMRALFYQNYYEIQIVGNYIILK